MDLPELVHAILSGDLLAARQWVADAHRSDVRWNEISKPLGLDDREMTVAAAVAELLAARAGAAPPLWTASIGSSDEPLCLDPGLQDMPRTLTHAKTDGPESFRRRNLIVSADFLDVR
jgi:hypothetical protein